MLKGKESFEELIDYLKIEPKDETIRKEALTLGIKTEDVFSFDAILLNDDFKNDEGNFNEIITLLREKKFKTTEKISKELKETFESKLRLLHLTTYSGLVDYETIMKDLKIEKDQVEDFIFLAVSYQLVKVFIDQNEWKVHFVHSNKVKNWNELRTDIDKLTKVLQ